MIFVIFAMLELFCQVLAPLQPHRVWRQRRGGRRYRGDWGSKNWPGKIIFLVWHRWNIVKWNAVKVNWKLILIYSQTEQAGAEQLVGHKANTRMPTDGLTNSISRFFLNSISYDLYNCGFNLVFFSWTSLLSFLRKTDHFSEDYKQVLLKRLIIIVIMVLRASFQITTQAVREREMSTNRNEVKRG